MLADDELRGLLTTRLPELRPDVETELERVLSRATTRARRRRAAYIGGLAAAVVATVLVLGHDWRSQADSPDPVDHPMWGAVPLRDGAGDYEHPWALNAGRYEAHLYGPTELREMRVELDVPGGWAQDDKYAIATGPGDEDDTRRIDLFVGVERLVPADCPRGRVDAGDGAQGMADALVALGGPSATAAPTSLGGNAAFLVRMHRPSTSSDACVGGVVLREYDERSLRTCAVPGWTALTWVAEVDGQVVLVAASHGPDVTPAEEDELVAMVESLSFVES
jgi:hypothetical protein